MVLISNKRSFYNLTGSYCFIYSYKIHNRVLITKMTLTKFAGMDECSKLKHMSDERLGYLTKSFLSQNFYRTIPDALKTIVSYPDYSISN